MKKLYYIVPELVSESIISSNLMKEKEKQEDGLICTY